MRFSTILKYFLLWQVAILIVTLLAFYWVPHRPMFLGGRDHAGPINPDPYSRNPLLYSRANFDGIYYTYIAQQGKLTTKQPYFPFYPKLIHWLNPFIGNSTITAVVISLSSFVLGLYFFSKLIELDFSPHVAKWSVISLLVFPTSFFFGSVYTEGLFFLLAVGSFYSVRTNKYLLAGLLGAIASYTRVVGVLLFPALLVEVFNQRNRFLKFIPLCLIPLGLLVHMYNLHKSFGDPFLFIHYQKIVGQQRSDQFIMPYQVFWRYAKMLATVNRSDPLYLTIALEAATGIAFWTIAIYSIFKFRSSYWIFSLTALLAPTLTGNFVSLPRYVLVSFPSFIILGQLLSTRRKARLLYLGACTMAFILFLALFVTGYWVA